MKLYKDYIELTTKEFKELLLSNKNKNRKSSKLINKHKDTIKHIYDINPHRSIHSVARELGISTNTVRRTLIELGLK